MSGEETKLSAHSAFSDFSPFGLVRLLGPSGPGERVAKIEGIIFEGIHRHPPQDDTVIRWLEILEAAYSDWFFHKDNQQLNFSRLLTRLFWVLPDVYGNTDMWGKAGDPIFTNTKKWILGRVIREWQPVIDSRSIETFQFLVTVCDPRTAHLTRIPNRSLAIDTRLRENRNYHVSPEEKKELMKILRQHIGHSSFTSECLEQWLILEGEDLPWDIKQILISAWARNGGWDRYQRIMKAG